MRKVFVMQVSVFPAKTRSGEMSSISQIVPLSKLCMQNKANNVARY